LSDSNHDGQDDPTSDDDGGQGAPSAEPTVRRLIGSGMAAQVLSSAVDQLTTATPLGSGHPKKRRLVLVSKRKEPASSDQVTIELFPHHAPRCSLGLVAARLIFWRLFEAFQCLTQAVRTDTSAWADTQPDKRLRAPSMRRMLTLRYVTVLTCALLFVNLSYTLMIHLSIGNLRLLIHRRVTQPAPSSYATSVALSVGVTGSTTLSAAEAWDFCRRTTEFLEGLKNREADQQGNSFTPSLFLSFDLFC
jgi:hypothetical protein